MSGTRWSHTELWRNTVDNVATATLISKAKAKVFHDEDVEYGTTYYYWAKVVDNLGLESGFSPSSGPITVAAIVPEDIATTWPGVRSTRSGAKTISHETPTRVDFDVEEYDTANLHSTVTNNTRHVAVKAGQYLIIGYGQWVDDIDGWRELNIIKNDITTLIRLATTFSLNGIPTHQVVFGGRLALNDYVELEVFQNSGGNLNFQFAAFSMRTGSGHDGDPL